MTSKYLEMMADSLSRKINILQEIERVNAEQKELFGQGDAMDDAAFDASVDRKGALIDEIEKLDDGFTSGTAMKYYQTMSKSANIQPQFFDNKK